MNTAQNSETGGFRFDDQGRIADGAIEWKDALRRSYARAPTARKAAQAIQKEASAIAARNHEQDHPNPPQSEDARRFAGKALLNPDDNPVGVIGMIVEMLPELDHYAKLMKAPRIRGIIDMNLMLAGTEPRSWKAISYARLIGAYDEGIIYMRFNAIPGLINWIRRNTGACRWRPNEGGWDANAIRERNGPLFGPPDTRDKLERKPGSSIHYNEPWDAGGIIRTLVMHELGHHIHAGRPDIDLNTTIEELNKKGIKQGLYTAIWDQIPITSFRGPSQYAGHNATEWLAENFAVWTGGWDEAIDPAAHKIIRTLAEGPG